MTSDFIIDVNEIDFEYEVLQYSLNIPVLVDFWATWCQPCKVIGPILEKIAREAQGSLRLARVDVDNNPNLAIQYNVRSIPTIKIFSQKNVVAEFVGPQPEQRIRAIISKITPPSPTELSLEKANSLLNQHYWFEAEELFREIINSNSENNEALLGLAKSLLGQGLSEEPLEILQNFGASKYYQNALSLLPYASSLFDYQDGRLSEDNDLDIIFRNSIKLAERGNLPAALDGLLDILRQDKQYKKDLAHQVTLALLELMGNENAQTRQYRSELASILF